MELTTDDIHYDPEPAESDYNGSVLVRVAIDAPDRCQAVHPGLQCPFQVLAGSKYCPRHAATHNLTRRGMGKADTRTYLLQKWRQQHDRHSENPKIKGLREDVGILRMTLEVKLNQIKDEVDLDMRSSSVMELVREIAKTVAICQKMEKENGELLDKAQTLDLVQEIVFVIADNISSLPDHSEILQRISNGIMVTLSKAFPDAH